ncbi:MAG: clostripain-related cysteine peptidase [Myxococcota bacterium]
MVASIYVAALVACGGDGSDEDTDTIDDTDTVDDSDTSVDTVDDTDTVDVPTHPTTGASWTVLVYMVADNNLEGAGLTDLGEMMDIGSDDTLHIVVQVDRAEGEADGPVGGLADFTTTKRVLVKQGSLQEVDDLGETDSSDPAVLADFIKWGVTTYPADRYAIVFWDHGGAWTGFGFDDSAPDSAGLNLPELAQGLRSGMQQAGSDKISQFALIGFDACLMASWENARTMQPFGEYLLVSEEIEPGHGWDYHDLSLVKDDPTQGPLALGTRLVDGFKAQATQEDTVVEVTLGVLDLYALPVVDQALAGLVDAMKADLAAIAPDVGREREAAMHYGRSSEPDQDFWHIDLLDFATHLASDAPGVQAAVTTLTTAVHQVVKKHIAGAARDGSNGISIYFPPKQDLYNAAGYDQVAGIDTWRDFLTAYYGAGQAVTDHPTFEGSNTVVDLTVEGSNFVLRAPLASGDADAIVDASSFFGVVLEDGTIIGLQDQPADVAASDVSTAWDATLLTVVQGEHESYAYVSLAPAEGGYVTLSIPFYYREESGGEDRYVSLSRTIDANTGELESETYYDFSNDTAAELYPVAGSELRPIVAVIDASSGETTWEVTDEVAFDPTAAVDFRADPLADGQEIYMQLSITDFAGESDYDYATATLGPAQ